MLNTCVAYTENHNLLWNFEHGSVISAVNRAYRKGIRGGLHGLAYHHIYSFYTGISNNKSVELQKHSKLTCHVVNYFT